MVLFIFSVLQHILLKPVGCIQNFFGLKLFVHKVLGLRRDCCLPRQSITHYRAHKMCMKLFDQNSVVCHRAPLGDYKKRFYFSQCLSAISFKTIT